MATASLPLANVSATYSQDIANSPLLSALTFREGNNTRLTVTPSYDLLDRLTSVQSAPAGAGETAIKAAYAYDILNQRTGLTNADNSFWAFGYDSKGQVQSGKHYWSDQTPVAGQQFEYQFDDIGNRKQMKSGGDAQGQNLRTTSYTCDEAWLFRTTGRCMVERWRRLEVRDNEESRDALSKIVFGRMGAAI